MAKGKRTKIKKAVGRKITLVGDRAVLKPEQILHILRRTPEDHVYQRPGKGGETWEYVTGVYVKKVLNFAFGWDWDFRILDKGREGLLVWVQGELTCRTNGRAIVKQQFGRAEIKLRKDTKEPLDYGNDLKAAATDALKKCASEMGIASDIYGKNEFWEIKMELKEQLKKEDKGEKQKPKTEGEITAGIMERIKQTEKVIEELEDRKNENKL